MLLNALKKPDNDESATARQSTVFDEKAAAADDDDHDMKKTSLFGEQSLAEHLRDGDRILVCGSFAVLLGPQLHTSGFGEACSVDLGAFDDFTHCTATETVFEIERHR